MVPYSVNCNFWVHISSQELAIRALYFLGLSFVSYILCTSTSRQAITTFFRIPSKSLTLNNRSVEYYMTWVTGSIIKRTKILTDWWGKHWSWPRYCLYSISYLKSYLKQSFILAQWCLCFAVNLSHIGHVRLFHLLHNLAVLV
jgi:hypothetical protein